MTESWTGMNIGTLEISIHPHQMTMMGTDLPMDRKMNWGRSPPFRIRWRVAEFHLEYRAVLSMRTPPWSTTQLRVIRLVLSVGWMPMWKLMLP